MVISNASTIVAGSENCAPPIPTRAPAMLQAGIVFGGICVCASICTKFRKLLIVD